MERNKTLKTGDYSEGLEWFSPVLWLQPPPLC